MKLNYFILSFLLWFCGNLIAQTGSGITTGDMTYEYLGPGNMPNTAKYQIEQYTSCDCSSTRFPDHNPSNALFAIWSNNYTNLIVIENVQPDTTIRLTYTPTNSCLSYREPKCMETKRFRTIVNLPIIASDYVIASNVIERREINVMNIDFSYPNKEGILTATIPGTDKIGIGKYNSSPHFSYPVEQDVCVNTSFFRDFSDIDPDGDVLNYHFSGLNRYDFTTTPYPLPPPFLSVTFLNPLTAEAPLGANLILNETTGILSGTAPQFGYYRVGIEVSEYRNGNLITQHTKESLIYVNYCQSAKAVLKPEYNQCKSFTFQFKNEYVTSLPVTYHWDFGVVGRADDTSNMAMPVFTYPDTGIYRLKLKIMNGTCVDSATAIVRVYPGFYPGFVTKVACANLPIQFIDTSKTSYGTLNSWNWDFGVFNTLLDTSTQQNPTYNYGTPSIYKVKQVVTNSLGCRDSVIEDITAYNRMFITASADTTICGLDTISLHVSNGIGQITWSPNYNIIAGNTDHPLVSPDTTTLYKVLVVAGPGCSAEDSVEVKAITTITTKVFSSQQICQNDTIHLTTISDGNYKHIWAPNSFVLSGITTSELVARPNNSITYTVKSSFGSCISSDSAAIQVFEYPKVDTYGDTSICLGKSVTIGVSGNADSYTWKPSTFLNDIHAVQQTIYPQASVRYTLQANNLQGCTKPVYKRVIINLTYPVRAFAGNDTVVIKGQLLQLHASGGNTYQWAPAIGLNNASINNPVAILSNDITYKLKVINRDGCVGYDSMAVKVFNTDYNIFIPTAFTPNNDGLNDVFKPLPVGISGNYSLSVYDRWGKLMFSASQPNKGWDGKVNGNLVSAGTYIWFAKGKAIDGKIIEKKGTLLLIR